MHECMRRECVDRHVSIRHLQKQIDQYEIDLKDAWNENDRLAKIVERMPKTADGVPLHRGMKVYWRSQDPTTTRDGRTLVTYGVDEDGDFEGTDENGDWIPFASGVCSTAEAAWTNFIVARKAAITDHDAGDEHP